MTRIIDEIKFWCVDSERVPSSYDGLLREFPLWLAKARFKAERDGVRFILVLDALDQLQNHQHARSLDWLPSHSFHGPLRLVVSTLPGDTLEALEKRAWGSLRVEPLMPEERRLVIADYLKGLGKTLDAARIDRLANRVRVRQSAHLKILLDELRVTGNELFDERLDDYLDAQDVPELLRQMLARYQRDYERDRPGLVSEALGFIWAARRGLSETELLRLLQPADQPQCHSPDRCAGRSIGGPRGNPELRASLLRAAVETAFVPDEDRRDELRLRLADDFERQPISYRSCDELPWLLFQTESYQRLRQCLLDVDRFLEIKDRDKEEIGRYWRDLGSEKTMGGLYRVSFAHWSKQAGRDENRISYAASELGVFLNIRVFTADAEPLLRRASVIEAGNPGPGHPHIAIRLGNLASLLESMNRLEEVEGLYRRALSITEQSFGPEHPQVAMCLSNLTGFLLKTNQLNEAEGLLRRALAIDEKCLGPNHPMVAVRLNDLAGLLQHTNRLTEAESLIRRSLAILESVLGPDHPNMAPGLNILALFLHQTNRLAEAEPLVARALAIRRRVTDPSTSQSLGGSTISAACWSTRIDSPRPNRYIAVHRPFLRRTWARIIRTLVQASTISGRF